MINQYLNIVTLNLKPPTSLPNQSIRGKLYDYPYKIERPLKMQAGLLGLVMHGVSNLKTVT